MNHKSIAVRNAETWQKLTNHSSNKIVNSHLAEAPLIFALYDTCVICDSLFSEKRVVINVLSEGSLALQLHPFECSHGWNVVKRIFSLFQRPLVSDLRLDNSEIKEDFWLRCLSLNQYEARVSNINIIAGKGELNRGPGWIVKIEKVPKVTFGNNFLFRLKPLLLNKWKIFALLLITHEKHSWFSFEFPSRRAKASGFTLHANKFAVKGERKFLPDNCGMPMNSPKIVPRGICPRADARHHYTE